MKDLQAKKQSIEDNIEDNGAAEKEATKARKIGFSGQPPPQCNGLPFSSYLDPERNNYGLYELNIGETGSSTQEDNLSAKAERVTIPENLGNGGGVGSSCSHHQLSPVQSSPEGPETAPTMPNSTSSHSIGQDVNQNITERTDGANSNASFKKRGSITFVITDHSDPSSQERKNSDSDHSECSCTAVDIKCPYHRKPSICESIPEEKAASITGITDGARLSQGSIQSGGILRLPPPSIRKSGRSMSECSDQIDYSLTPDGMSNYTNFPVFLIVANYFLN